MTKEDGILVHAANYIAEKVGARKRWEASVGTSLLSNKSRLNCWHRAGTPLPLSRSLSLLFPPSFLSLWHRPTLLPLSLSRHCWTAAKWTLSRGHRDTFASSCAAGLLEAGSRPLKSTRPQFFFERIALATAYRIPISEIMQATCFHIFSSVSPFVRLPTHSRIAPRRPPTFGNEIT